MDRNMHSVILEMIFLCGTVMEVVVVFTVEWLCPGVQDLSYTAVMNLWLAFTIYMFQYDQFEAITCYFVTDLEFNQQVKASS